MGLRERESLSIQVGLPGSAGPKVVGSQAQAFLKGYEDSKTINSLSVYWDAYDIVCKEFISRYQVKTHKGIMYS